MIRPVRMIIDAGRGPLDDKPEVGTLRVGSHASPFV